MNSEECNIFWKKVNVSVDLNIDADLSDVMPDNLIEARDKGVCMKSCSKDSKVSNNAVWNTAQVSNATQKGSRGLLGIKQKKDARVLFLGCSFCIIEIKRQLIGRVRN